jgi:Dyp-type peroxidase family
MAPPPKDEPVLALDEIQGNVMPGFKKDHQHFVFFSISDPAAARVWLNKLHTRLSSAAIVLDAHRVWKRMKEQRGKEPDAAHFLLLNIALSASGLAKLTSKAEVDDFDDVAFKLGQSERSTLIGDPASAKVPGHAAGWLVGGPKHAVDGVLILASDDLSWLEGEQKKLVAELSARGMKVAHEDRGDVSTAPTRGHEQFGFKDDISRPAVRGRWPTDPYDFVTKRTLPSDAAFDSLRADFAAPGSRLIWPGHVIFGYGRQMADDPRTYDAANQAKGPAWAKNGSFMVYRRLRQHTDVFWKFVEDAAKQLAKTYPKTAPDKDRLAACLIGRWKTGTPLARSPDKDIGITGDGLNYFSYASKQAPPLPGDTAPEAADPDGLSCPLGAHIRKVNPRDQATDLGISEHTPPRSILRRGITYAAKDSDKGLLFVAYQSSIKEQFEFLMRMWANKENTPRSNGGLDPILSQNPSRAFHLPIDGKVENIAITKSFVEPTGGEYFFAPSIGFFKNTLAGGAKKRVTEDVESFELRHRAEEGEEETEMVPPEVDNDDALPLPFDELLRLDGAEEGAAAEVEDEWPDPSTAP